MFEAQGLGTAITNATVLVLDTGELRTTALLMDRHQHDLRRVIVVERDGAEVAAMELAIQRRGWAVEVEVVPAEDVIAWLTTASVRIDFMWLDLMSNAIRIKAAGARRGAAIDPQQFAQLVRRLDLRGLAVTLSNRLQGRDSVSRRNSRLARSVAETLPHKLMDWGYRVSPGSQSMQLLMFGRRAVECTFRVLKVEATLDPNRVRVYWWGYPDEPTLEPGPLTEWVE
jgi:hypothetical protein